MRTAVTGTPGTGKTTATEELEPDQTVIHLNEVVQEKGITTGRDQQRDSAIVDVKAVREWLADRDADIIESHLAHLLPAEKIVVLRCRPTEIERRLTERGVSDESAVENAESEALDVILTEAVERHGEAAIYEIETTDKPPADVATAIRAVQDGDRDPAVGTVSYVDYLDDVSGDE